MDERLGFDFDLDHIGEVSSASSQDCNLSVCGLFWYMFFSFSLSWSIWRLFKGVKVCWCEKWN